MTRVNMEESVFALALRVARIMGWSVREAWGTIGLVYRATQGEGVSIAPRARIVTLVAGVFDDDEQAERFLDAMVAAHLASVDGDMMSIRGNKKRLEEITEWRDGKVRGGKARAEQRKAQQIREQDSADASTTQQDPAVSVSVSVSDPVLTNRDLVDRPKKPRRKRTPETDPAAEVIREHRRLLAAKNITTTEKISDASITQARKVLKEWPSDWAQVLAFFVSRETEWNKRHHWPLSSLIRWADDYDQQWRNAKPKPKEQPKEKTLADLIAEQA